MSFFCYTFGHCNRCNPPWLSDSYDPLPRKSFVQQKLRELWKNVFHRLWMNEWWYARVVLPLPVSPTTITQRFFLISLTKAPRALMDALKEWDHRQFTSPDGQSAPHGLRIGLLRKATKYSWKKVSPNTHTFLCHCGACWRGILPTMVCTHLLSCSFCCSSLFCIIFIISYFCFF